MRYLCFDIECCDGEHICEFGYVITDEQFNPIERECWTINPEKKFNLKGRPYEKDLDLYFSEEVYFNSPTFDKFYDRIKTLIEAENQMVIGHAITNDITFLRTACKRYSKKPLSFNFIDSQKVYSEYANTKRSTSLENVGETLHIEKPVFLHKSDDDAYLTVCTMKAICENIGATLIDLKKICKSACGECHKFHYEFFGRGLNDIIEQIFKNEDLVGRKMKAACFKQFVEEVKAEEDIINSLLNNKKLCFSPDIERKDIKHAIQLVQLLANHGCGYDTAVPNVDYYVASNEELEKSEVEENSRYNSALIHEIKVISLNELYEMLGVTKEDINKAPLPNCSNKKVQLPQKNRKKTNNEPKVYTSGEVASTLGDALKAKGIDLSKLFVNEEITC